MIPGQRCLPSNAATTRTYLKHSGPALASLTQRINNARELQACRFFVSDSDGTVRKDSVGIPISCDVYMLPGSRDTYVILAGIRAYTLERLKLRLANGLASSSAKKVCARTDVTAAIRSELFPK